MKLAELKPEQLDDLTLWSKSAIGILCALAGVAKAADIGPLTQFGATRVAPILEQLDDGEVLKNPTNYAGTSPLTIAQLKTLRGLELSLVDMLQKNMDLVVSAIGINGH